jgi:hypothetical protein
MTEPTSRQPPGCHLSCERNAFQGLKLFSKKLHDPKVLISLARGMLFREYPSGTRINKGFQAAVGNNCTRKHLIEF